MKILLAGTRAREMFVHDFLILGEILQPVTVEPYAPLRVTFKDLQTGRWATKTALAPAVLQQANRSPDGMIGWVLVNRTDHEVTCTPQPPLPSLLEEMSTGRLRRIGERRAVSLSAAELEHLKLAPAEVALVIGE